MECRPAWPLTLPGPGLAGLWRRVGDTLQRLVHAPDGTGAIVRVAQPSAQRIVIGARSGDPDAAAWAVERVRFALGVDDDLRDFYDAFAWDPLIGASVRGAPGLRPRRTPVPFEALAAAVTEQLIEFRRAVEIQRALTRRFGLRCAVTGLRDAPPASRVAGAAPAEIESCGLAPSRAIALRRAAAEVAAGRVDLFDAARHDLGWRRLRAIPGIGSWTLEVLATAGQGRFDRIPAGDLAYVILVARLQGRRERATEHEVRAFFAPYAPWQALAGLHALRAAGTAHLGPAQGLAA